MFFCYILKSELYGKYYIGCSADIEARLRLHNEGFVKSTKHYKPWIIIYIENFTSLSEARKRELQIKNWKNRSAIERLIARNEIEDPRFLKKKSGQK